MNPYSFTNLKQPKNTTSGVTEFILLAPVADFAEGGIQCPQAPFAVAGDKVKITTPHLFLPDRAFAKIVCAPEKNKFDGKTIGDPGSHKFEFEMSFFIAGSYAELHEAIGMYLNTPLIAMQLDNICGADIWYQAGNDKNYAYLSGDFTSGTDKDGAKGYTCKIIARNTIIMQYDVAGGPVILGN